MREAAKQRILQFSPTGKVPALRVDDLDIVVCESLGIIMFVSDCCGGIFFPQDPAARALCVSACLEMHSGFPALRTHMPMNCCVVARQIGVGALARDDVRNEIGRLCSLWGDLRSRYGESAEGDSAGPFLFGKFSAADCMFAPVALRFRTYDPELTSLNEIGRAYVNALLEKEEVREWVDAAKSESFIIPHYEPHDSTPI